MARNADERPVKVGDRVLDERRKYRRTRKRIRIEFHKTKLFFLKGPADLAEAVDISTTGVRLNTKMELEEGDSVSLLMRRSEGEPEISFSGKVAWVKPVKEGDQEYRQAGVELTRLGLKQRVLLVRLTTGL
ncbi:MAG: hypothetical protein GF331_04715 [Chitinivibrionales bacterium]|nr:hypothetical protein [Chitinivibrionales bacterium]